jgi:hypothetical protein
MAFTGSAGERGGFRNEKEKQMSQLYGVCLWVFTGNFADVSALFSSKPVEVRTGLE